VTISRPATTISLGAGTVEIAAHVLTEGHADDAAKVPALLGQAENVIVSVTADSAYDGEPTDAAAAARQRSPPPDVVVPPWASAALSSNNGGCNAQSPHSRQTSSWLNGSYGLAAGDQIRQAQSGRNGHVQA